MANCFGDVIDSFKLDTLARYVGKPKTQEDRAREAENLSNLDGKSDQAYSYVHGLKSWYGPGASTLCVVYNQTGDTLHYINEHDFEGFIGRTPYPTEIGNGQWAAFHHCHNTGAALGSKAAVIYRGKDKNGQEKDFLLAWRAPTRLLIRNKAYCSIGDTINSFHPACWGDVQDGIDNYAHYTYSVTRETCSIEVDIGEGYSPVYKATIKIPFSK